MNIKEKYERYKNRPLKATWSFQTMDEARIEFAAMAKVFKDVLEDISKHPEK